MEYTKKKFVGNTTWMMINKIYSMLISLIVGALSARYLGPSNYGLLNYGTSIISFFTTISGLGFASTIVVEMIQNPKICGKILGTATVFRFITSIASFVAIFFLVALLEPSNKELIIVTMLQALAVIINTYEVFLYWFQMNLEMRMVTIASMIALTVTAVWRIALLAHQAAIEFFALSSSITAVVSGACVLLFFFKSENRPKLGYNTKLGIKLISSSYHFVISGLAVTLYTQLDRIMLGKMVNSEAVGYYSAAMTIATMWEFVPQALINSARPVLINIKNRSEKEYLSKYRILLLAISIMGIIIGILFVVFGKLVIYILYGDSYMPAVPSLMILIWSTSFSMIGTARSIWVVAENKNKYVKYYVIIGAIVNAVLNAIAIPIWGITGASITTLVSQIVVAIIAPYFFKETREFCNIYWDSFKCFPELIQIGKQIINDVLKKRIMGG